jgi:hypothetical protein
MDLKNELERKKALKNWKKKNPNKNIDNKVNYSSFLGKSTTTYPI